MGKLGVGRAGVSWPIRRAGKETGIFQGAGSSARLFPGFLDPASCLPAACTCLPHPPLPDIFGHSRTFSTQDWVENDWRRRSGVGRGTACRRRQAREHTEGVCFGTLALSYLDEHGRVVVGFPGWRFKVKHRRAAELFDWCRDRLSLALSVRIRQGGKHPGGKFSHGRHFQTGGKLDFKDGSIRI